MNIFLQLQDWEGKAEVTFMFAMIIRKKEKTKYNSSDSLPLRKQPRSEHLSDEDLEVALTMHKVSIPFLLYWRRWNIVFGKRETTVLKLETSVWNGKSFFGYCSQKNGFSRSKFLVCTYLHILLFIDRIVKQRNTFLKLSKDLNCFKTTKT